MSNPKRVIATLVLTAASLSAGGAAHADTPGNRLPKHADAFSAKSKDEPEIISIIKTTIEFNKSTFEI
ncbi:hypothetical protein ACFYXC_37235 [Streptomyces sp. NPDC002701]|uniref:hypothetical protein n=1 Tax=Streptomyces sp. NPDC002701 TaxID=3364661 RepID=UPI0036C9F263